MNRWSRLRLPQGLNSLLKKSEEQITSASMRATFSPIFCMEGEKVSGNGHAGSPASRLHAFGTDTVQPSLSQ